MTGSRFIGLGCPKLSTHILTRRMTIQQRILVSDSVFQLTSSQGGWRYWRWKQTVIRNFQLTSSQGGWPFSISSKSKSNTFNSHPHKEDDRVGNITIITGTLFQLTSSQGGWQYILNISDTSIYSFNSHPHKEDDVEAEREERWWNIFQLTSSQGGWQQF